MDNIPDMFGLILLGGICSLTVVLVTLKIIGIIHWSWWLVSMPIWVTSMPLWTPAFLVVAIVIILVATDFMSLGLRLIRVIPNDSNL